MPLTTTSYRPAEIRFFGCEDLHSPVIGVKLKSGIGALAIGTLLGRITASGLYKAYSASNTDGSEVAVAILGEAITVGSNDTDSFAYIDGWFTESALTGVDTKAKAQLGAKSYANGALHVSGGSRGLLPGRAVTASTTQNLGDTVIEVGATSVAPTITLLPVATVGPNATIYINAGPDAATRNVTIDGDGSETIDGATTKVLSSAYGVARLRVNAAGTAWLSF